MLNSRTSLAKDLSSLSSHLLDVSLRQTLRKEQSGGLPKDRRRQDLRSVETSMDSGKPLISAMRLERVKRLYEKRDSPTKKPYPIGKSMSLVWNSGDFRHYCDVDLDPHMLCHWQQL